MLDLRPEAPEHERATSVQFFRNCERHLEWLCDLIDLDPETVQAAVRRQYPACF